MIDPARLTAYVASRICHDIVSPITSALPALEMMEEPTDAEMRSMAEGIVKKGVEEASTRVQFLRYAFGTGGLSDSTADIHAAKALTEDYVRLHKHTIEWDIETDHFSFSHARLMMNVIMGTISCLVTNGTIRVQVRNDASGMVMNVTGNGAFSRSCQETLASLGGTEPEGGWNARNVQLLFCGMVADSLGGKIKGMQVSDEQVLILASDIRAAG